MPLVFTILSSSLQNASTLPRKCQCTQNDEWRIIASSSPPAKRRLRRPPDEQKVGVASQLPTTMMYVPSWRARRGFFFLSSACGGELQRRMSPKGSSPMVVFLPGLAAVAPLLVEARRRSNPKGTAKIQST